MERMHHGVTAQWVALDSYPSALKICLKQLKNGFLDHAI